MSAWLWLLAAVVFVVIEITNLAFFALFAAGGAVAAAVVSGAGGPPVLQVVVFAVVALGGLVVLRRPLLAAFGHRRRGALKSGVAALVGQRATVVDRVDHVDRTDVAGLVHARGEDWPAITYDDQPCEPGQVVEVIDIDKTRLVVTAS
ncbi:MAG TPA: NfeD family protein [Acidimicrobiales bacterium]|nr:NfeD family protein [Acidimicrobiales bacterium]